MGKELMISQPLKLPNGSILRNRIVKAAMSEALGDVQNDTTEGHIKLFERWSKGGAAMLITGNVQVDRWHLEHAANIVLDDQSNETCKEICSRGKKWRSSGFSSIVIRRSPNAGGHKFEPAFNF